jgi:hypothetical protein
MVASVLALSAITAERTAVISCTGEQIGIIARDPAKVEHLAAHISLN